MDKIKKTLSQWIYEYLGFIFVFVVASTYVTWGLTQIGTSGKEWYEIIADGVITFFMGILIVSLLRLQGLIWGKLNIDFINTMKSYGDSIVSAIPFFKYLFRFVSLKNRTAFVVVRTHLLASVGLQYDDYFNKEGKFIGKFLLLPDNYAERTYVERQNKAIDDCIGVNITLLSPNDLTSENGKAHDPNYLGQNEKEWFAKNTVLQIGMTAILSFIFAYFALQMAEEFSWADLIWKLISIVLFVLNGFLQLYLAYRFITGEFRNRFIRKTDLLDELVVVGRTWEKEKEVVDNGISKTIHGLSNEETPTNPI